MSSYAKCAWFTLCFTVFVIIWGAVVRATGSGAGCGSHWPLCNGEVVPVAPAIGTIIEFSHRLTSGLSLLLVVGLAIWGFRAYPKGHPVRLGAVLAVLFMIVESLVGAALVLFKWVAYDDSASRVLVVGIHLINTFLLLIAITLTAWWASGKPMIRFSKKDWQVWAVGLGLIGFLLIGATGAITALGDTLFPAESLLDGLHQKYDPNAHFAVQLRTYHPLMAIFVGAYLVGLMHLILSKRPSSLSKRLVQGFTGIYLFQLFVGAFNVVLLAPVWIQIIHLLIAEISLIILVLFVAQSFSAETVSSEQQSGQLASQRV